MTACVFPQGFLLTTKLEKWYLKTCRHVEIIVHAMYRVERNGAADSGRSQTTHKKEEMNCPRRICF